MAQFKKDQKNLILHSYIVTLLRDFNPRSKADEIQSLYKELNEKFNIHIIGNKPEIYKKEDYQKIINFYLEFYKNNNEIFEYLIKEISGLNEFEKNYNEYLIWYLVQPYIPFEYLETAIIAGIDLNCIHSEYPIDKDNCSFVEDILKDIISGYLWIKRYGNDELNLKLITTLIKNGAAISFNTLLLASKMQYGDDFEKQVYQIIKTKYFSGNPAITNPIINFILDYWSLKEECEDYKTRAIKTIKEIIKNNPEYLNTTIDIEYKNTPYKWNITTKNLLLEYLENYNISPKEVF